MSKITCVLLLISIIGCSSNQSGSTASQDINSLDSLDIPEHLRDMENLIAFDPNYPSQFEISFTPEESYGEIFSYPPMWVGHNYNTVSVDESGRVYVMDRIEKGVNVYGPDGEFLSKIGREGKGPGEFIFFNTIQLHGERLVTYDIQMKRTQWFDLDSYKPVEVFHPESSELQDDKGDLRLKMISSVMRLGDGNLLVGGDRSYVGYYVMTPDGKLSSERLFRSVIQASHRFGGGSKRIPSSDEGIVDVSPEGTIYHANTAEFLIHAINTRNNTRKSIYYPYKNAPIDREKVLERFGDFLGPRMRDADFGEHWPALHSIMADDENRIWISTITEDADTYTWWVLKDSGELLGKFDWPRALEIKTIRNGSMYVHEENEEEGVFNIQRYAIQLDPIPNESVKSSSIPIDQ